MFSWVKIKHKIYKKQIPFIKRGHKMLFEKSEIMKLPVNNNTGMKNKNTENIMVLEKSDLFC